MLYPVENEVRQVKELSGIWRFKLDPEENGFKERWFEKKLKDTIDMPVPASYNDITADKNIRDHVGWVWYEREFILPDSWKQERIVLRFGSATHHAVVYLNGKEITRHKGGFLPFEADITDIAEGGSNRLTVAISNMLDWTCLPCGEIQRIDTENQPAGSKLQTLFFDFFNYSGIHRPVKLYTTPKQYIHDITVKTDFAGKKGIIRYDVAADDDVVLHLYDENGESVASGTGKSGALEIENAIPWEPLKPYLYTLEVISGQDKYSLPVGIRTIRVEGTKFLINEKPFYFKGFGRHEDSNIHGRGMDLALNARDFSLLKWIGANSFRTSHYPYSEEMMQMADRAGIVVIDEVPAVGMCFWSDTKVFTPERVNDKTLVHHLQVMEELYERDKNHPCVVMWSIGNEPATNEENSVPYFTKVAEKIKSLDDTRPITLVMTVRPEHDLVSGLCDVVCVNRYYSWYEDCGRLETIVPKMTRELKAWYQKYNKPVFVTEYGADTIAGLHKVPEVIFSEEYQVEYLRENHKAFDACDFLIGEHVWNFADFMTKFELRRVDGNKKGVFTRDRQPKAAAFELRRRWLSQE